ncbi:hypothetical protein Back11_43370 [Paenibacillus baekrokdamisoli]|uniref:Uncharacterized protein n=1 Tax=Paenibacillus baekrokdamisoli TaxID=1712516 RepID=A0A3G9IXD6_9BACL|nr:amidase family protein [Paenibacillus baekrokdamisoli]MBB3067960.1 Asp-tRNA(Asn)/Glu-tRNA(Gln) amidotransferase A subunit family amidase [Paenibacillus baekrokdamisoli]BBH22992.1 hypothetical protein Back11_43370 [Paenibacillus baekrokdamisoli]
MLNFVTQWKKQSSLIVAGALLLTVPLTAQAAALQTTSPAMYQGDAQKAISLNLGNGKLDPNAPLTSRELVTLLNQSAALAGQPTSFTLQSTNPIKRQDVAAILRNTLKLAAAAEPFKDVLDQTALSTSVGSVFKAKLMNGVDAAHFAPGAIINHNQAYAIAYRVYDFLKPFQVTETTIADIQKAMDQGKLTSKQLVEMYLKRIQEYDDQNVKLSAIITVNPEALQIAEALDKERAAKGPRGPLHGVPVIVKDNYDTADMVTTAGCLCLKDFTPSKDAEMVAKLKAAGAIIMAKANLHEFAFGITSSSSLGGQTLNPYALDHYPGGSSGGTAAAIASNFALAGLGTDTGASIRIPASYNNLVGIRPTMGLTSRDGIIPLALSQDVGGPLARTVTDAAIMLDVTAGYDPDDTATAYGVGHIPTSYTNSLKLDGLKGARIGVATELFGTKADEQDITNLVNKAIGDMRKLGAVTVDIKIPNLDKISKFPSLSNYEFKFQLNDYLAKEGDNAPYHTLTDIINSGLYDKAQEAAMKARDARESLDTVEYKDILLNRTKITQEAILKVMADNKLDAIIYPTTMQLAAVIGTVQNSGVNTRISPFTGFPAISVPAGFTPGGLPAGFELLGRAFDEPTLIKLAYAYEQGTHNRKAPTLLP